MDYLSNTSKYSASFNAGSLLHRETTSILHLLEADNAQELLKNEVKNNQYIQINSETSRKRVITEITKRYAVVKPDFWGFYKTRNIQEQKVMLFYLCLKCYKLMFDYHFNVTVKRIKDMCKEDAISAHPEISLDDYISMKRKIFCKSSQIRNNNCVSNI